MDGAFILVLLVLVGWLWWWLTKFSPARLFVWTILTATALGYAITAGGADLPMPGTMWAAWAAWVIGPPIAWTIRLRTRRERGL